MWADNLAKLINEGKEVSFFLSPYPQKGKYVCDVGSKDEVHFVFADTVEGLLNKLGRKNLANQKPEVPTDSPE
jgi:hypothetical protein